MKKPAGSQDETVTSYHTDTNYFTQIPKTRGDVTTLLVSPKTVGTAFFFFFFYEALLCYWAEFYQERGQEEREKPTSCDGTTELNRS